MRQSIWVFEPQPVCARGNVFYRLPGELFVIRTRLQ